MAVALEQFVKQLEDSGVISSGNLKSFIPPEASPKDSQELARQLILSKQLTKYQVQEIYQGRAKSLILGNYTILDRIGAGGMGQVFKAEHRRMHRVVAIKMLPTAMMKDPAAAARFQREVEAAARLSHRNIVASYDANEANGIHFLAMEYVDGSDLSALVKRDGPFSVAKAVDYILQAGKGLEFAHGEHVVHRDIKPANLLLDPKGTIKILDMGLARIESGFDAASQAELTGTGAVLGTVDYMAPEQSLGTKKADARADIYSLGCTMFYLLIGKPIYGGESITGKLLAHHQQPIPDLCKLKEGFSEALQAVFSGMVAKKVEDRYQTMSEVVAALESPDRSVRRPQASVSVQQSIDTMPELDALTFLNDVTLRTVVEPKIKKKPPAPPPAADDRAAEDAEVEKLFPKRTILKALAAAGVGTVILAAVLIALRSRTGPTAGALTVKITQPDAAIEPLPKKTAAAENPALNDPSFQKWMQDVGYLPAEQQVQAVVKKLQERNPGFDGQETHKIEDGIVREFRFLTDRVTNVAPVRALTGLKRLSFNGNHAFNETKGRLSDLSPIQGLHLTWLDCGSTLVADLAPLKGMQLAVLRCYFSPVHDLSPLKGMPLQVVHCDNSQVADLSPLKGMKLTTLSINQTPVSDLSPLKGMPLIRFECASTHATPADIAAVQATFERKPITTFKEPTFQQWAKNVAAMPAEMQVEAVVKVLRDLNPEFDGNEAHKIENGVVTELQLAASIADISPIRALTALKVLRWGDLEHRYLLTDISPLEGMRLTDLDCESLPITSLSALRGMPLMRLNLRNTRAVTDLSPLQGMPLKFLDCGGSGVRDLTFLKGLPLETLICDYAAVANLSPLRGMPLTHLDCTGSAVSDLTPLQGMKLKELRVARTHVSDLSPLKGMPLTSFSCEGLPVADLAPLQGIPLTDFNCSRSQVADLSPLHGMPLASLDCNDTVVSDLSPLRGMRLMHLACWGTQISDLSPLRGMPLQFLDCSHTTISDLSPINARTLTLLHCHDTRVSDLSPLRGAGLTQIAFSPQRITKGLDAIRLTKSLTVIADDFRGTSPDEFWEKYDAGEFSTYDENPIFRKWMREVATLPAEKQLEAVTKQLRVLNPTYQGGEGHKIENGVVTELALYSDEVLDLSPVRALTGLKSLSCRGSDTLVGRLNNLTPLSGMRLTSLNLGNVQVYDLSPLEGMPLTFLDCHGTHVFNLTPLRGMPLTRLEADHTRIVDLAPLHGLPLTELSIASSPVSDLSPLSGLTLTRLQCSNTRISDLAPLQNCDTLKTLSLYATPVSAAKIADLRKHLPKCQIEWPTPGVFSADKAAFQVDAVIKKLRVLNPTFRGPVMPRTENGAVTEVDFNTDNVTDISPLHVLTGLKILDCSGTYPKSGILADLSPLKGLPLTILKFHSVQVADLSPLRGMPLTTLECYRTNVSDLSPLKGIALAELNCGGIPLSDLSPLQGMPLTILTFSLTKVSDLSPLKGMPLSMLACDATSVSDLSPLKGMSLKELFFSPQSITKGIEIIREMKSLERISIGYDRQPIPSTDFWKKYDAGEFK